MKKRMIIFLTMFVLLFSNLIIAPPPGDNIINTGSTGFQIEFPIIDFLEINENFTFNFHLFNLTNGIPLSNKSPYISMCSFHLYNQLGNHIFKKEKLDFEQPNDFKIVIDGSNFSNIGIYNYIIQCNSSQVNLGGFASISFEIIEELDFFGSQKDQSLLPLVLIFLGTIFIYFFIATRVDSTILKLIFVGMAFVQLLILLFINYLNYMGRDYSMLLNINFNITLSFFVFAMLFSVFKFIFVMATNPTGQDVEELAFTDEGNKKKNK